MCPNFGPFALCLQQLTEWETDFWLRSVSKRDIRPAPALFPPNLDERLHSRYNVIRRNPERFEQFLGLS